MVQSTPMRCTLTLGVRKDMGIAMFISQPLASPHHHLSAGLESGEIKWCFPI